MRFEKLEIHTCTFSFSQLMNEMLSEFETTYQTLEHERSLLDQSIAELHVDIGEVFLSQKQLLKLKTEVSRQINVWVDNLANKLVINRQAVSEQVQIMNTENTRLRNSLQQATKSIQNVEAIIKSTLKPSFASTSQLSLEELAQDYIAFIRSKQTRDRKEALTKLEECQQNLVKSEAMCKLKAEECARKDFELNLLKSKLESLENSILNTNLENEKEAHQAALLSNQKFGQEMADLEKQVECLNRSNLRLELENLEAQEYAKKLNEHYQLKKLELNDLQEKLSELEAQNTKYLVFTICICQ